MEAIIWKLCTSKALGSRQRTVMLWQGRERLASNVHFMPSFLQENPVLSVLSWQLWVLAPQSQPTPSRHAWVQAGKVRVWGQGFWWRKVTDTQIAQGWEETGPPNRPVSPGLWVPTPRVVSTAVPELYATCCMGAGDDRCMGTSSSVTEPEPFLPP